METVIEKLQSRLDRAKGRIIWLEDGPHWQKHSQNGAEKQRKEKEWRLAASRGSIIWENRVCFWSEF